MAQAVGGAGGGVYTPPEKKKPVFGSRGGYNARNPYRDVFAYNPEAPYYGGRAGARPDTAGAGAGAVAPEIDAITGAAPSISQPQPVFKDDTVFQDRDQTDTTTDLPSSNWEFLQGLSEQSIAARQAGITAQEQASMEALGALETGMNRRMGMEQLQNERDIAKRRMMSVRSGMSSTNLAAQEMQNLMAGQVGATKIAEDTQEDRMALMTQFAGQREMAESYGLSDLAGMMLQDRSLDVQGKVGSDAARQEQLTYQWMIDQGIFNETQIAEMIKKANE